MVFLLNQFPQISMLQTPDPLTSVKSTGDNLLLIHSTPAMCETLQCNVRLRCVSLYLSTIL